MESYLRPIVEGVQSTFGYFLFGSFLLVPILALVVLIIWIAGFLSGRRQWSRPAIDSVTFLLLVFIVGAIPNFLFDLLLRNRWYDTVDPLIAFLPFFPSIELAVDSVCGGRLINGITPMQFYLEWFFAALATWSTAAVAYRHLTRNRRAVQLRARLCQNSFCECVSGLKLRVVPFYEGCSGELVIFPCALARSGGPAIHVP